jgi:hypothetical protein
LNLEMASCRSRLAGSPPRLLCGKTPAAIEIRTASAHPEPLSMGNAQHFPAGGAVIKKPHTQHRLDASGGNLLDFFATVWTDGRGGKIIPHHDLVGCHGQIFTQLIPAGHY